MKVEVKEKTKTFEPIEIKLTIESEEELCDLWHRVNLGANILKKYHEDYQDLKYKTMYDSHRGDSLFGTLDDLVLSRDLKR